MHREYVFILLISSLALCQGCAYIALPHNPPKTTVELKQLTNGKLLLAMQSLYQQLNTEYTNASPKNKLKIAPLRDKAFYILGYIELMTEEDWINNNL